MDKAKGGVRRHFNYSNVMSTLAVFMVVAGGTALATVSKDDVGSKQVKDNSLKAKDLKDNKAVGSAEVIDNSLTGVDIDESQLTLPAQGASGAAGGALTGSYPNPGLADNSVGTTTLQDNAVNSAKVADNDLTADDLGPNSVNQSEIATDGVGELELQANSVSADELLDINERSATSAPIAPGSTGSAFVQCAAGEQVISGGNDTVVDNVAVVASRRQGPNGWGVFLRNNTGGNVTVTVRAYCLTA